MPNPPQSNQKTRVDSVIHSFIHSLSGSLSPACDRLHGHVNNRTTRVDSVVRAVFKGVNYANTLTSCPAVHGPNTSRSTSGVLLRRWCLRKLRMLLPTDEARPSGALADNSCPLRLPSEDLRRNDVPIGGRLESTCSCERIGEMLGSGAPDPILVAGETRLSCRAEKGTEQKA